MFYTLLTFKEGQKERNFILKKQSILRLKKYIQKNKHKILYKKEIQEGHWYRLVKTTFKKWRIFRVKCLRRKKQLVRKIQEKARDFYFKISFVKYLNRWRELYLRKTRVKNRIQRFYDKKCSKILEATFKYWGKSVEFSKLKRYVHGHYCGMLIKKSVKAWAELVRINIKGRQLQRKANRKYSLSLVKKTLYAIKNLKMLKILKNKEKIKAFEYRNRVIAIKAIRGFKMYIKDNQKFIIAKKYIKNNHKHHCLVHFFKTWYRKLIKINLENQLCDKIVKSRQFNVSKILFHAWIRRYYSHSSKINKINAKIYTFQQKYNKKKLVSYTKKWIKLYKSKENYRKMKKLSREFYSHKICRRYFVGFSIILEKASIYKLKLLKATKNHQKKLLKFSFRGIILFFNSSIKDKVNAIYSVKHWCFNMYKKVYFQWNFYVKASKAKKNFEKLAWDQREKDLIKKGLSLCIKYGLEEKSKREAKIRELLIKNTKKTEFLKKKYGKLWLKNYKKLKTPKKNSNPQFYEENYKQSYRTAPKRLETPTMQSFPDPSFQIPVKISLNLDQRLDELQRHLFEFKAEKDKLMDLKSKSYENPNDLNLKKLAAAQEIFVNTQLPEIKKLQQEIYELKLIYK